MAKLGVGIQGGKIADEVGEFETLIGRPVKVVRRYMAWDDPLVDDTALWAANTGHDAIIALESFKKGWKGGQDTADLGIRWLDIAAGKYDADLTAKGQQVIDLATSYPAMTIYLEFHHEPEDDVDSIAAQGACGTDATEFLKASAYVRQFWRKQGMPFKGQKGTTRNVRYGHCLMGATYRGRNRDASEWFPANMAGIDFIASDGYNRGPDERPKPKWRTFTDVFGAGHDFAKTNGKPFVIQECGLPENNVPTPNKAGWFDDASSVMKGWGTDLEVFMYSHVYSTNYDSDYHVDTSPASLASYTKLAKDPFYAG